MIEGMTDIEAALRESANASHNSEGGSVSDIQTLTQSVREFSHSVDLWNQWMLGGLALTVLAAIFVLVATRMVVFRSGQMSTAQDLLSEAKDRQLALDLREKDKKIAEANERAEREALARSTLEMEFVKRGPRFTLLRTHRSDLVKKLRSSPEQRFTTLNCFANTDTEAIRTSSEITVILESEADWRNNTPHSASGGLNIFNVGVMIRILPTASQRTREAATQLFSALHDALLTGVQFADNGQDVKAILPRTIAFDEDTVLIEVGEHPVPISTPYASGPKIKNTK
jgi:hypothetical protein